MHEMNFLDVLRHRVESAPDHLQYRFIERSGQVEELTCASLWSRSAEIAAQLIGADMVAQPVLIACTSQRGFVISLYACFLADAIAVPAPSLANKRLSERIGLLARDSRAAIIVVDSDAGMAAARPLDCTVMDLRARTTPGGSTFSPDSGLRSKATRSSIAILQYTSGTTGTPKGVMVSHGNLLANCIDISRAMRVDHRTRGLTPLPLFHDMGLVGGVLQPLYAGCEATFMEPAHVATNPQAWLQSVDKYRITHSGGPDLLFDLASRLPPELTSDLDLSSWQLAFCGAEPIRTSTLKAFASRFNRNGFRASSLFPCYGLAECTLFVAGTEGVSTNQDDCPPSSPVVSCGRPSTSTKVIVVNPTTGKKVEDGVAGEIWLQGPSVAMGYWGHADLTQNTFSAFLDQTKDGPYLRTGDLGVIKNNDIYVQGRVKDLIIAGGRKFAPQDLEHEIVRSTAEAQLSAAFSYELNDRECLGIAVETSRRWLRREEDQVSVISSIRRALFSVFQLRADVVELLPPGALPRTSSGKVRRSQAREDFLQRRHAASQRAVEIQERRHLPAYVSLSETELV